MVRHGAAMHGGCAAGAGGPEWPAAVHECVAVTNATHNCTSHSEFNIMRGQKIGFLYYYLLWGKILTPLILIC